EPACAPAPGALRARDPAVADAAERVGAAACCWRSALRLLLLLGELGDRGLQLLAELLDRFELVVDGCGIAALHLRRLGCGRVAALGVPCEVEVLSEIRVGVR